MFGPAGMVSSTKPDKAAQVRVAWGQSARAASPAAGLPLLRLLLPLAPLPVHHFARLPHYPFAHLVDDQRNDAGKKQPKPNSNRVRVIKAGRSLPPEFVAKLPTAD
jgi:hypothetical protein